MLDPIQQEWTSRFEDDPAVIYILDRSFRLVYCNAAWDLFALKNGGAPKLLRERQIGRSVMQSTPVALIRFYHAVFTRVLSQETTADHIYDCSSPDLFRQFHMHIQRLEPLGGAPYLVVVNSLVKQRSWQEGDSGPFDALRQKNGAIVMCAHCEGRWSLTRAKSGSGYPSTSERCRKTPISPFVAFASAATTHGLRISENRDISLETLHSSPSASASVLTCLR